MTVNLHYLSNRVRLPWTATWSGSFYPPPTAVGQTARNRAFPCGSASGWTPPDPADRRSVKHWSRPTGTRQCPDWRSKRALGDGRPRGALRSCTRPCSTVPASRPSCPEDTRFSPLRPPVRSAVYGCCKEGIWWMDRYSMHRRTRHCKEEKEHQSK